MLDGLVLAALPIRRRRLVALAPPGDARGREAARRMGGAELKDDAGVPTGQGRPEAQRGVPQEERGLTLLAAYLYGAFVVVNNWDDGWPK